MRRFLPLLAAALLAAPAVRAAAPDGSFAIRGVGANPCSALTAAVDAKSEEVGWLVHWMDGYLTAVNRYRDDTFDVAPWPGPRLLLMLVDAHCRQRPQDPLYEVVHQLVLLLGPQRLTRPSEPVEIAVGERRRQLYREIVRRMQQALIDLGLLKGKADGVFGPKTREALAAFQKSRGLEATGFPDDQTLFELFLRPVLEEARRRLQQGGTPPQGGADGASGEGGGG